MKPMKLAAALLLCLLTSASGRQGEGRGEKYFYGTVVEVNGPVFLDASKPVAPRVTKGTRVYGGQMLGCRNRQGRCVVKVDVCDVYERRVVIAAGTSRRIPSVVCKPPTEELEKFRTAGRDDNTRGGGYILTPTDYAVFRSETFVIRWRPSPRRVRLSLSIKDEGGVALWEEEVDESKGFHASARLREALRRAQARGSFTLWLTAEPRANASAGRYDEVTFRLLAESAEASLKGELASWESESGVMRHLGRAGAFGSHEFYAEAAEEFEKALSLSPRDADLMLMTITAEGYARNWQRVKTLCTRLRRVSPQTRHCACAGGCGA